MNEDDIDSDRDDYLEDEDEANDVQKLNWKNIKYSRKHKIVCFFRKSTVKNHIFQDKIKLGRGEGHSLELKLDVKSYVIYY